LEVFCVLLVKEEARKHVVYCLDCARRQTTTLDGYVALLEYHMDDLVKVYDDFRPPAIVSCTDPNASGSSLLGYTTVHRYIVSENC
jgi:histone demethylase